MNTQQHLFVKLADIDFPSPLLKTINTDYLRDIYKIIRGHIRMLSKPEKSQYHNLLSASIRKELSNFAKRSKEWECGWVKEGPTHLQMIPLHGGVLFVEDAWSFIYDLVVAKHDMHLTFALDKDLENYVEEQIELLLNS